MSGSCLDERDIKKAIELLQDNSKSYHLPNEKTVKKKISGFSSLPRQLVGQPASPGLASGQACCINTIQDFKSFKAGSVLVCDSIQPQMTHLVPMASAIIERRGGMLIHGAIIDRELDIPCVNGIEEATQLVPEGVKVTVDGHLGIVTIGESEFEKELL